MLVCTSKSYMSAQSPAWEVQGRNASKSVKLLHIFSMQLQEPLTCCFAYSWSSQ